DPPGDQGRAEDRLAAAERGDDGPVEGEDGVDDDRRDDDGKGDPPQDASDHVQPASSLRPERRRRTAMMQSTVIRARMRKSRVAAADPRPKSWKSISCWRA